MLLSILSSMIYLYETISSFEAGIFNKVCHLQSQLMPQPVNFNIYFSAIRSSEQYRQ